MGSVKVCAPLLPHLLRLARKAGSAILAIYAGGDIDLRLKSDSSPVTRADKASHDTLVAGLAMLDNLPVVSEESEPVAWTIRQAWSSYWLVDPLDGTKEFVKRNGEFTVNIALIHDGEPVVGVVYVPVTGMFFYGGGATGSFQRKGLKGTPLQIRCSAIPSAGNYWRVLGSRSFSSSHSSSQLETFLEALPEHRMIRVGSSLKFCMIANGAADLYPRFSPTYEWDTAAAQAIVEGSGGQVLEWETLEPLRYNTRESLLNPSFIACAQLAEIWCRRQAVSGSLPHSR